MKLMMDSGSKSTVCSVEIAKGYATDDTERAKLWDIQCQKIEAHDNKIIDVKFHGQANETLVRASMWMCQMSQEMLFRWGRLLKAGLDLQFMNNHGYICWMMEV